MIFINFKTFREGTGREAVNLVTILESVSRQTNIKIIPVVQASDVKEIANISKLEIWTQKIDPVTFGAHTGAILAEAVYEDGAVGTFLNHSESKLSSFAELESCHKRAKEVGLKTLVFSATIEELAKNSELKPDFISFEPAEFIGNTTVSVSLVMPDSILKAVEIASAAGIPLIVGAGIHSKDDVSKSLEMGATGVAVATDIVKSVNPRQELFDLIEGFGAVIEK